MLIDVLTFPSLQKVVFLASPSPSVSLSFTFGNVRHLFGWQRGPCIDLLLLAFVRLLREYVPPLFVKLFSFFFNLSLFLSAYTRWSSCWSSVLPVSRPELKTCFLTQRPTLLKNYSVLGFLGRSAVPGAVTQYFVRILVYS